MSDDFTRCRMTWLDQIYDDMKLTASDKEVGFRLSRYFNRKRFSEIGILNAWPSYETIAAEMGVTVKTIYRAVTKLRDRNHLDTSEGRGRSRTLQYRAIIKLSVVETPVLDTDKSGQQCPVIENKPDIHVPKTGHLETVKLDTNVLQTSLKKSLNKSLNAEPAKNPSCEPFKAGWSLAVFRKLSRGAAPLPRPSTAFLRQLIEVEKRPDMILDHQSKHGCLMTYGRSKVLSRSFQALPLIQAL